MNEPKVSIVIPVYNGADYLKDAIDSALNQTYKNIEVIVINDGSDDEGATEKVALSYGNRIRYFEKENGGVASALNMAIMEMNGDYFSWLSHDDFYVNNKIDSEINLLIQNKNSNKIVICNYYYYYEKTGEIRESGLAEANKYWDLSDGTCLAWNGLIYGCTLLIPRFYFAKYGLFNEKLITTQDYDMWYRIFINNRVEYIDKPLVFRRVHAKQGSVTIKGIKDETDLMFANLLTNFNWKDGKHSCQYELKLRVDKYLQCVEYNLKKSGMICRKQIEELLMEGVTLPKANSTIESIISFPSKCSKIYIWGAGVKGKKAYVQLKSRGIDIEGFIESNRSKWGSEIYGKKCFSIFDTDLKDAGIIVSPMDCGTIIYSLREMGFSNYIELKNKNLLYKCSPDIDFLLNL